jgi:hypothetical protein
MTRSLEGPVSELNSLATGSVPSRRLRYKAALRSTQALVCRAGDPSREGAIGGLPGIALGAFLQLFRAGGANNRPKQDGDTKLPAKEASYEIAYFAEKHGISLKAAEIILTVNGPSKRMCDATAVAFVAAVAARAGRAKKKDLPIALRGRAIRHPARSH